MPKATKLPQAIEQSPIQPLPMHEGIDSAYWNRWAKLLADPKRLIIQGNYYHDGGKSDGFQGFGGKTFHIKRLSDGEVLTTSNLLHSGGIPEDFRKYHPDTHDFVEAQG